MYQAHPPRIALLFSRDLAFARGVLGGIQSYLEGRELWHVRHSRADPAVLDSLRRWKPDGVIGHISNVDLEMGVAELGCPALNTTLTLADSHLPVLDADHLLVGKVAAEHLLDQGYQHFAYFGSRTFAFSRQREEGFRKRLAEQKLGVAVHYSEYEPARPLGHDWLSQEQELAAWLRDLPKPVGIMGSNDIPVRDLAVASRRLGLRIPDEVGIVGVDDDRFECCFASPTLTSIVLPTLQIGFEAAEMMSTALRDPSQQPFSKAYTELRLIVRESTDTLAVEDPLVRNAGRYMRSHRDRPMTVEEVAQAVGCSRRTLERRFRAALGRTVLSEIHHVRVQAASQLLAQTYDSIESIATRCGFGDARTFRAAFRSVTGESPSAFRAYLHRAGALRVT
jgi:LacI family transcriptional regulator